jgi:hypothetical protein
MNPWHRLPTTPSRFRLLRLAVAATALAGSSVALITPAPAGAAPLGYRIDLKVLVLDDGTPWVDAIKSQMTVEGVPFTSTTISTVNLTDTFLTGSASISTATRALYQAVVVPDGALTQLSATERTTLRTYEAKFGIRQVNAWDSDINTYATIGLGVPTFNGDLNGATATVNAAGKAAGFGYLNGPVPFSIGSFAHIAPPLVPQVAGAAFTTLVESAPSGGGATGTILGVYSSGGVEQMVITSAFASTFLQFKYLGHGIITWMTRGVHFGYNRNNFTFHADDAFGEVSTWNVDLNCTPGEDCTGPEAPVAMTAADVAVAVNWMQANNYQITMAFNGFHANTDASNPTDPSYLATKALLDNKAAFRWLNHGFEHLYQGCQQNTTSTPWVCMVDALLNPVWVSQLTIYNEIQINITRGQQIGLTGLFDVKEYLSGEHSGLQFSSAVAGQNQSDNPNFIAALAQAGIKYIGSDASRETSSRVLGTGATSTTTIPRHPTALYYNTATKAQAIDEYNWFYAAAPAGSGACGTTVPPCITPLTLDSQFDSYIVPTDTAFDLGFILSNDPRPFYAHVSNMTGDRLAYYLLDAILNTYRSAFTAATPVVNLTLTQAADQLVRQQQWTTDRNTVTGFVQNGAISITNSTGHVVPFTAPAGSTIVGNTLASYGGESSGWLTAGPKTGTLPAPVLTTTGGVFPVGQSSTMTFAVTSAPTGTVLSVSSNPALPAGLTYTTTPGGGGTITGIPPVGSERIYTLSVNVVSAGYNNVETVLLTVPRIPIITSAASATAVAGSPFSFNVSTTGIPAAAITVSGTLPSGVTLTGLGNGTATLAGTPALATGGQSFPLTLTATNVAGVANQSFTLVVNRVPAFTSPNTAVAVATAPFSFTITTVGTPVATITRSGALPPGITFNALGNGTATLSGTAPLSALGQSYPIALTATNSAGVAHQTLTITVTRSPQFTSGAAAVAAVGEPFSFNVAAVGAPAPTITISGSLPAGITFSTLGNGAATLSGTAAPAAAGQSFPLTFTATNSFGVATQAFTLTVEPDELLVSLTPARLADTRPGERTVDGLFAGEGIRSGGSTLELTVTGRGGVPSDAAAVSLNVTAAWPTQNGFATVYPCGSVQPLASNINYTPGAVVPNAVIAKVGTGGKVCLFVSGETHLIVDVNGYLSNGSSYRSMNPARVLETRPLSSTADGLQQGDGIRLPGTITNVQITNRVGIPADATAVVLNVTVTEALGDGYATVYPCGTGIPTASNINFATDSTVANMVIVKIGSGGGVCIYNSAGTQLVVDVNGYFPAASAYTALDPARLLETRPSLTTIDGESVGSGLLPAGAISELTVNNRGGVSADAATVVLNVTVTETKAAGFVTAYPCGIDVPLASNLNYGIDSTVAVAVIVRVGSNGKVCFFNSAPTQLVVDVNGFLPS